MTSIDDGRTLLWDACRNVRDLGGLPTVDGGVTRRAALVRADSLCRLTPPGCRDLVSFGVRTVIDLRFSEEVAGAPHPFRMPNGDASGVGYRNVPITTGRDPSRADAIMVAFANVQSLTESYRLELTFNQPGFANVLAAIARAPVGGVVVHCQSGKDRTGLVIALLLALIGVPDAEIAGDYELSAENVRDDVRDWVEAHASGSEAERERLTRFQLAERATMLHTLDFLRQQYGGAEQYLRAGGLDADEMLLLHDRLLGR